MQVLKFGGTSLGDSAAMSQVVDIVYSSVERDRTILVCSAISRCTDTLIKIGNLAAAHDDSYRTLIDELQERHHVIIKELLPLEKHEESLEICDKEFEALRSIAQGVYLLGELSQTSLDAIQGRGELISSRIVATKLASVGIATKWVDSRKIIRLDEHHAVDLKLTKKNVLKMIEDNPIASCIVLPGFIAYDVDGRTATLGRGGSDYSASLAAVCCKARVLEIWTDVTGMMTANPKIVPGAKTISNISYRAALELSHFGAKVIYPPTIQPVVAEGIPIVVKNTFNPQGEGTLIEANPPHSKEQVIGLSNADDIALLSLEGSGMVGIPGITSRLFEVLSREKINIILITQASSVHTMCIAVAEKDADKAKEAADNCFAYEISLGKLNPLKVEKGYSIVCLVADDILTQRGTTGRMLAALGRHSICVRATAQGSSERNVSVIVAREDVETSLRHIHHEFFEKSSITDVNIFIAGYGVVGKALVNIIKDNSEKIIARTGKRVNICGLSNSRKYVINTEGVDLASIEEQLANGNSAANEAYFEALASISMGSQIFVDCTASSDIAYKYVNLFKRGYSVVACNKITFSAPYKQYQLLKEAALENSVSLKYETTVGAALPILESIARSVHSGDEILRIEAVLSGTLNYIYSTYKGGSDGQSFADVVAAAQKAGYTEPDPRLDLSGRDVLRKLLILSREAGVGIDEKDVEIVPILAPDFFEGKVDSFYQKLREREAEFAATYAEAANQGKTQRVVASLIKDGENYRAKIALQAVGEDHPFYNLRGTDNAALIQTDFYPSPLVIQGAGAGAKQTASGVLNDILV